MSVWEMKEHDSKKGLVGVSTVVASTRIEAVGLLDEALGASGLKTSQDEPYLVAEIDPNGEGRVIKLDSGD